MAVTVYEVAVARGVKEEGGGVTMGEFDRVGLPMLGGCEVCGASIAAYNAAPSLTGNLRCSEGCIGDNGFPSVKAFEAWSAYQDALVEASVDGQCSVCGENLPAVKDDEPAPQFCSDECKSEYGEAVNG